VSLPVTTTPEADAQIRTIDDWWRKNRPASPNLFDELSSAFDLIAHAPNIGRLYRRSPIVGTRRVLLRGSRHHVYYVSSERAVIILAVWHGERGTGPPLTAQP
jgi:plasmid stabilization system protein ParE